MTALGSTLFAITLLVAGDESDAHRHSPDPAATRTPATRPKPAPELDLGSLRHSVSILRFRDRSGWAGGRDLAAAWHNALRERLGRADGLVIIEAHEAAPSAPDQARLVAAQLLVGGTILEVEPGGGDDPARIAVRVEIVDSSDDRSLASTTVRASAPRADLGGAIAAACDDVAEFFADRRYELPWRGWLVNERRGRAYLNRGTREGVAIGHRFVIRAADARDPASGRVARRGQVLAELEATRVKKRMSICELVSGSPSAVAAGVVVEAVRPAPPP